MHDAAEEFLRQFGGLAWPTRELGEHLASYSFNLDPLTAVFENDRFDEASAVVGETLYPVGEVVNGHYFLGLGPSGTFYLVMNDVSRYGDNPWEVLGQLLLGSRP